MHPARLKPLLDRIARTDIGSNMKYLGAENGRSLRLSYTPTATRTVLTIIAANKVYKTTLN